MGVTITELKSEKERDAAVSLHAVFSKLQDLTQEGRRRVYARWEHLKLISPGDATRWEKEFRRVTEVR